MFAGSQSFLSQTQVPIGGSPVRASPEEKKPRQEEKQTVLPATIRSVETAASTRKDDGELYMFGSTPSLLVLCGVVEAPDIQASSAHFIMNDSTGRLPVRCFAADGIAESIHQSVKSGAYVIATGQVRFLPELHFTAIQLRSVTSGDEIAYHVIESAHAALKLRAAPVITVEPLSPVKTPAPSSSINLSSMPTESLSKTAPASAPAVPLSSLNAEKLLAYLTSLSEDRPEGISRAAVHESFSGSTESEVKKLLEELVASGDAFTTIDDDHFSAV